MTKIIMSVFDYLVIAVTLKIQTDDQVEQLRLAILQGGEYDLNEIDQRGYSSLHWAGIGLLIIYDSFM